MSDDFIKTFDRFNFAAKQVSTSTPYDLSGRLEALESYRKQFEELFTKYLIENLR